MTSDHGGYSSGDVPADRLPVPPASVCASRASAPTEAQRFAAIAAVGEAMGVSALRRLTRSDSRSDPEVAVDALIAAGWRPSR